MQSVHVTLFCTCHCYFFSCGFNHYSEACHDFFFALLFRDPLWTGRKSPFGKLPSQNAKKSILDVCSLKKILLRRGDLLKKMYVGHWPTYENFPHKVFLRNSTLIKCLPQDQVYSLQQQVFTKHWKYLKLWGLIKPALSSANGKKRNKILLASLIRFTGLSQN